MRQTCCARAWRTCPAPPKPRHAAPQTVAQAVSACLHARMALLRSLGRHAPDSPQVAPLPDLPPSACQAARTLP